VNSKAQVEAKDLSELLRASIDNDDSMDLDELTVSQTLPDNQVKILVAVADRRFSSKEGLRH